MSMEENLDLVSRYFDEIWNKGNLDAERRYIDENVVVHASPVPGAPAGVSGALQVVGMFRSAMPDLHVTNDVMIAEGDKVIQHYVATGTHNGAPLFGVAALNKQLSFTGVNEFRIGGGKIVERWGVVDAAAVLQQLGLIPAPPQRPAA